MRRPRLRPAVRPAAWLAALLPAVAGCGTERPPQAADAEGASVILISIDTLRADRLPLYGYRNGATPHIDALAADAVVFERAYSHYPVTLPSHASLFTGLLPPQHGVRNNKGYFLAPRFETLAERLQAAGYRTAGFVSSAVLRGATGVAQGFEHYVEPGDASPQKPSRAFAQERGDVTLTRLLRWLDGHRPEEKLFLFLHLFDPHTPYEAPEPFAGRHADPYDAEVAYTDDLVGRLLAELRARGLYQPALVVLLADHGEGLGDHVEEEHGIFVYRESLQVPLLIKLPHGQGRGRRVAAPVALIDVSPTLLDLLRLDREGLPGRPLLGATPPDPERPIYSETFFGREQYGLSELRSIVMGDLHYIAAPRPELYDLAADPGETRNLLPRRELPQAFSDALAGVGRGIASTREVSDVEERRLAALGYVGGPGREPLARKTLPDPKDRIREVMELWSLMDRVGQDDTLATERRVKELLELLDLEREPLRRSVANNLLKAGHAGQAFEVLERFAASPDVETQLILGEIDTALGRVDAARARFQGVLAREPANAVARRNMGILLLTLGQPRKARTFLEKALELDPQSAEAWNALGVVRAMQRNTSGAVQAWEAAVRLDPALGDAWFNLALMRREAGNRQGAIQALERYLALDVVSGPERRKARDVLRELRAAS